MARRGGTAGGGRCGVEYTGAEPAFLRRMREAHGLGGAKDPRADGRRPGSVPDDDDDDGARPVRASA